MTDTPQSLQRNPPIISAGISFDIANSNIGDDTLGYFSGMSADTEVVRYAVNQAYLVLVGKQAVQS